MDLPRLHGGKFKSGKEQSVRTEREDLSMRLKQAQKGSNRQRSKSRSYYEPSLPVIKFGTAFDCQD